LKLFDVPDQDSTANDPTIKAAENALRTMAKDLEIEDLQTQLDTYTNQGTIQADDENDIYEKIGSMNEEEANEFCESVLPIWRALVKVSSHLDEQDLDLTLRPRSEN
jgi:hypothetical protein